MVTGIERWKEYFNDYKDKYVLIGVSLPISEPVCGILSSQPITLVEAKERTSSSMNTIALQIQRTRHIQSR